MDDRERQLETEGAQRQRVALFAILAGVLYLAGQSISIVGLSSNQPSTGLLQGLTPALHGLKAAVVDPRAIDERYLDHHAVEAILGSLISAVGLVLMVWPFRYLRAAEVARGGRPSKVTLVLASAAPPVLAAASLALQVSTAIGAHKFITHAVQNTAAYNAATGGLFRGILQLLLALGYIGVAAGIVLVALRAMRVGLLTRAIGILGIAAGAFFLIPIVPLPLILFLYLIGVGMLLLEVGGMVRPPAWATGEAIPWVNEKQQQRAAARAAYSGRRREAKSRKLAPVPTPPSAPSPSASKKRKHRRG
jgi:hypothetical protein